MPLSAKLVVVGGEVKSAEIKLRLPSTIGRGRGATIMLPHPLVSRQHCELFETNGRLMVRDLGSLNGTFVNNERISEAPLPPGELLTVGAVTFRAVYDTETSAPPAGPSLQLKSGHSRDTDPNGTARSAPQSARETHRAKQASEPTVPLEDFDFELPVTPVDEVPARPTDPAPPVIPAPPVNGPEAMVDAKGAVAKATDTKEADPASPDAADESPGMQLAERQPPGDQAPQMPETTAGPNPEIAALDPPSKNEKSDSWKWAKEDEESPPAGQDDDDFGDFLKSLGPK